jgi:serine/threonine-protein kinase
MADKNGSRYGRWETIEELGSGGQGTVFRVRESIPALNDPGLPGKFSHWISSITGTSPESKRKESFDKVCDLVRQLSQELSAENFALKLLHGFESESTRAKALDRLRNETEALRRFTHPSLINIVDCNLDDNWFVMEYHPKTLSGELARTHGDLLASLLAIRPVVEAVALLHENNFVHRDIKPDNVFVATDSRLVLGDFGLVVRTDESCGRFTDTYENVGSRDWMPGWAMGMRLGDVKPSFDVFSLGKLLWAMISGKTKLRLWYLHDPEFELEQMFPDKKEIGVARTILDKCIVEREKDCLTRASELLGVINTYISLLSQGGQLPRNGPMQCRVCALGHYSLGIREDPDLRALACDYCGNIQWFSKPEQRPGWH